MTTAYPPPYNVSVAQILVAEIVDRFFSVNDLDPETRRGILRGLAAGLDVPIVLVPPPGGWPEVAAHQGAALVEAVGAGIRDWDDDRRRRVAQEAQRVAARLMELVKEWREDEVIESKEVSRNRL